MPTPVRVRGKKGNRLLATSHSQKANNLLPSKKAPFQQKRISKLEQLPNELLHDILWQSLNLNLAWASPILARKLNNAALRQRFVFHACFTIRWYADTAQTRSTFSRYPPVPFDLGSDVRWVRGLITEVLEQPWLTADFYFACLNRFLRIMVPPTLLRYVKQRNENQDDRCAFNRKFIENEAPEWFPNFIQSFSEYKHPEKISYGSNGTVDPKPTTLRSPWAPQAMIRRFCLIGNKQSPVIGWTFQDGKMQGLFDFEIGGMEAYPPLTIIPNRLFEVGTWTQNKLDLLLALRRLNYPFLAIETSTVEAIRAGLMGAIEQKFIPAIIILSQSFDWNSDRVQLEQRKSAELIRRVLKKAITSVPPSSSGIKCIKAWMRDSGAIPETYRNPPIEECEDVHQYYKADSPATSKHVIRAMELTTSSSADEETFFIYQWVCLCWRFSPAFISQPYPEDVLQKVQHLAMIEGTAEHPLADTDSKDERRLEQTNRNYGNECYSFLDEVINGPYINDRDRERQGDWTSQSGNDSFFSDEESDDESNL